MRTATRIGLFAAGAAAVFAVAFGAARAIIPAEASAAWTSQEDAMQAHDDTATTDADGHGAATQRSHQPGAVAHPNRKMRHPGGVQIAQHPRIGDQRVGQHHQVRLVGGHHRMPSAAARHPGPRTTQRPRQQV